RRQPVVVVVPTGDEIRPIGAELGPGEIPDTNSLMLAAQAREAGCVASVTDIVPDDPDLITAALRDAAEQADLVILIAGSSAGRDDYSARVIAATGTSPCTASPSGPGTPSCWEPSGPRRSSAPRASRSPPPSPSTSSPPPCWPSSKAPPHGSDR